MARLAFQLGCFGLIVHYQAAWAIVFARAEEPEVWQRDWYQLWLAGQRFVSGEWGSIYSTEFTSGSFWLYPPYALYLVAGLALLPATAAYGFLIGLEVGAVALCVRLFRQILGPCDWLTFAAGAFASAAFTSVVVIGQSSGLLALSITLAAWLLARDRPVLAGIALAFLGLKPNWVFAFVALLVVTRRWKAVAAMATTGAVLMLSTIPLGPDLWGAFATSTVGVSELILERYQPHMLITMHAFWRSVLPEALGHLAVPLWLLGLAPMGLALLATWIARPNDLPRALGAAVLFTISANVYTNFYDALLLIVPAASWWGASERYGAGAWWAIGGLLSALWLWQWISLYGMTHPPGSFAGPLVAGWLLVDGWDAWRGREAR